MTDPELKSTDGLVVIDPNQAPIIYFEGSPVVSHHNGNVGVGLVAGRTTRSKDGPKTDFVSVAHLKCSISTAKELISALNSAILLAQKTEGPAN